ncbi:MAG: hypothetical protein QXH07_03150 [Thermoplasmata archaeon]
MIKEIIEKGLEVFSKQQTEKELGNRELYIGASDIASCPRKALLEKFTQPTHDTQTLIRFLRGHIAETIVSNALSLKDNWVSQVEVVHPDLEFVKAHIDFVMHDKAFTKILIIEVKSTEILPDEPYGSWQNQVFFQIGLMKEKYPNADIRGTIFAVNVNSGEYKEYDSFTFNETIYKINIEKAVSLWEKLQKIKENGEEEEIETEVGPLCNYCMFKPTCRNFSSDIQLPDELKDMIIQYKELSQQEKEINRKKEEIKKFVIDYLAVDKYTAKFEGVRLDINKQLSKRVDTAYLKENYNDIYNECLRESVSLVFKVS